MAATTRGFVGRRRDRDPQLPPGQYDTGGEFPVLTAEATPRLDPQRRTLAVDGLVKRPNTCPPGGIRIERFSPTD